MKLADFLDPKDREAVLGDLAECPSRRGTAWEVAGLILRRQAPVWVALIPAAVLLTFVMVRFGGNNTLRFWVLRNYADLDPAVLVELSLTKYDILRQFLEGASPPALGALLAGFALAKYSGRALWLNATFFAAVSVATLFYWHPLRALPVPFLGIFLEVILLWIPLAIGTRLKKRTT
jgi:hypothetical protein